MSLLEISRVSEDFSGREYMFEVDESTTIDDAVEIRHHMRPGFVSEDTYKIVNPELLERKAEASHAAYDASNRILKSIIKVSAKIDKAEGKIKDLEELIARGGKVIEVGPPVEARGLDMQHVIYKALDENVPSREVAFGPPRELTVRTKRGSKKDDAKSQLAFWRLNLHALKAKAAGLVAYRTSLHTLLGEFQYETQKKKTRIGSGYADYTFRF